MARSAKTAGTLTCSGIRQNSIPSVWAGTSVAIANTAGLSTHFDVKVRPRVYLLTKLNWFHWLQAGVDGAIPGVEGLDAFNFGSPGVAGNDIVTSAAGVKFKPSRHQEIGFAFEFPLTERRDIIDNRITVDWIFRF